MSIIKREDIMEKQISYTEARNNLSNVLNQVCISHSPIVIKRKEGNNTVIVSEDDWNSIQETLYLMSSAQDWHDISAEVNLENCSDSLPW